MTLNASMEDCDAKALSGEMYQLIQELYPICRSITGDGLRQTLRLIQQRIPLTIYEVPSGTQVFDWTIPPEWNIKDAYIKNTSDEKIIDFQKSNLHVINYSVPVKEKVSLSELKEHLVTLPDHPDWIPYRTTYYKKTWGFCLSHRQLLELAEGEYEVCIDSSLEEGQLSYGEFLIEGQTPDEVLFSCHACHPSLCNDNLSSIAVATFLARYLRSQSLRYSYRFLFIPGTIGSITWLSCNEARVPFIKHGLVLACLGDAGAFTYKKSRRGDAEVDKVVEFVLQQSGHQYTTVNFSPYGYDERQFCSPGFNLPVGCFMRTPHGCFPEYHTSADNLEFVRPESLAESLSQCLAIVNVLENNKNYVNQNPKCEPQLGKRGLYRALGGEANGRLHELAMLWVLNYSDGSHSLMDIANQSGLEFGIIQHTAKLLLQHNLLREVEK